MPQHPPGCQLGHCGHTPVLPGSPVWLSWAQSRSVRFSLSLVPHEAVNGGAAPCQPGTRLLLSSMDGGKE